MFKNNKFQILDNRTIFTFFYEVLEIQNTVFKSIGVCENNQNKYINTLVINELKLKTGEEFKASLDELSVAFGLLMFQMVLCNTLLTRTPFYLKLIKYLIDYYLMKR